MLEQFGPILFVLVIFSLISRICASYDRKCEITDMELPTAWCWILFFGAKNPFRKKTVIFQSCIVVGGIITTLVVLLSSDFMIIRAFLMGYLGAPLFLATVLGVRIRRDYLKK